MGWAVARAELGGPTWGGLKRVKPISMDLGQGELNRYERGLAATALDNLITALPKSIVRPP